MGYFITLVLAIIAILCIFKLFYKGDERALSDGTAMGNTEKEKMVKGEAPDPAKPDTRGLMFEVLRQLGCQPVANDDGTHTVRYQGENFYMEFGGMYVRVWDPAWTLVKVDDPDLQTFREAVNAANFEFGPTVVMTKTDDDGNIYVHSRRDIMLHPACPDNAEFVKAVLESFFMAKEHLRRCFREIKDKHASNQPTVKDILSLHNLNLN